MDNREELEQEMFDLLNRARKIAIKLAANKNKKIPKRESLNNRKTNKQFDIDIFFSRKPGMKRSIQIISSNAPTIDDVRLSCLVALASLCDTVLANEQLHVTKEDIVTMFITWMEENGVRLVNTRNTNNSFNGKFFQNKIK